MAKRRMWVVACVFAMVLAVPRTGTADILDFIWSLSGPEMIGGIFDCWIGQDRHLQHCTLVGKPVVAGSGSSTPVWVSLSGGVYVSTGKNSDGHEYEFGKAGMLSADPMLMFRFTRDGDFILYHGVGASGNILFGQGFDAFAKGALKFRPAGVIINHEYNISYNLRIYPKGFTADEFDRTLPPATTRDPELVHGFSFGMKW